MVLSYSSSNCPRQLCKSTKVYIQFMLITALFTGKNPGVGCHFLLQVRRDYGYILYILGQNMHFVGYHGNFIILFYFIFFSYFYQLEANYFTILQWFLPYIDMNQLWIYMYSPSQSSLPPPSPSHPSGSSQCTSPEHLSHASNLGWRSVSHLIVYLLQCYSL